MLQARERVEQMEEEKKRRLEQKHAQHEEKNEKVSSDVVLGLLEVYSSVAKDQGASNMVF